jgi:hypothetical protein
LTAAVIILCVAALVIILLVIPLRIELRGSVHNRFDFKLRFEYLFGLVSWESSGRKGAVRKVQAEGDIPDDYSWLTRYYDISQTEGLWDRSWTLARRLWGRVKIEKIDVDLTVSLGDDYYTGTIAGFLIPVCLFVNRRFATDINLRPAFEEDLFIEGHIDADWWVVPGGILIPCLAFIFSAPFRQAYHKYHA